MQDELIQTANNVLELLARDKNVLLTGAPATGKTTLLNLVEQLFTQRGETTVDPYGPAAFPLSATEDGMVFPGGGCKNRRVFRTTFHQGTKYRDFVRGLIPVPDAESVRFKVSKGLLWKASEFAKQSDCASLLIIDEINRGPAVSIFGDMISAFEADKRLGEDGNIVPGKTVTVQVLNDNAELEDYQLPSRLYILAAMNQADSSVEPMDTAFMRRWRCYKLFPSMRSLCQYFGIDAIGELDDQEVTYPSQPADAKDVYKLAAAALAIINRKITLGRGEDYAIGQGAFMKCPQSELPQDTEGALRYIADCWPVIDAHIDEIFFNDKEALAEVLNASENSFYKVSSFSFAGRQVTNVEQPYITHKNVYSMLLSLVG
jgi:5-methylcytosine-specific restriction protein B